MITPGEPGSTLGSFLTLLWTYMEQENMREFLRKLVNYLSSFYKEVQISCYLQSFKKYDILFCRLQAILSMRNSE